MIETLHNHPKKAVNLTNIYIKKSRKIISILVVLILLSTVASSVVSSLSIKNSLFGGDAELENKESTEKPLKKLLDGKSIRERIRERLEIIKENILERLSKLKNRRSGDDPDDKPEETVRNSPGTSLTRVMRTLSEYKKSGTSLYFYTNYNDVYEKQTELPLFKKVNVDVNYDGTDDISARCLLYPSIEPPLSLCINFRLIVKQLDGFKDLDKNASFDAYLEFFFLGILNPKWKGDRVRFGYQSPLGEDVPDECNITYKFLPYLFRRGRKPETRLSLNPGSSANKDMLILQYSRADMDNDTVLSQTIWRVNYSPVVESTITIGSTEDLERSRFKIDSSGESKVVIECITEKPDGNTTRCGVIIERLPEDFEVEYELELTPFSEGGGKIEFERITDDPVNATLFVENKNSLYLYAKNPASHITISWLPGLSGWIEANTHGEHVEEIGLCDDLVDPTFKIYFRNWPSIARVSWDLIQNGTIGVGSVNVYSDATGLEAGINVTSSGSIIDAVINSYSDINITASWSLSAVPIVFSIERSSTDIGFSLSVDKDDEFIDIVGSLQLLEQEEPFEVFFGPGDEGGVTFNSGVNFDVSYFSAKFLDPEPGGLFDEPTKILVDIGSFSFNLSGDEVNGTVQILPGLFYGTLTVDVVNAHVELEDCTVTTETIVIVKPRVNITSPSEGDEVNGTITIKGYANDDDDEDGWVEKVEVKIDDGDWQNATFDNETGEWYYIWNTTTVENGNGEYKITAKAFDNDGNEGKDDVKVIVNNTGVNWYPYVNILSPSKDEIVSGVVTISGTASDKDGSVAKVEIKIDEGDWQNATFNPDTGEWFYIWDLTTGIVKPGSYIIKARSFDGEYYSQEDKITVYVLNVDGLLTINLVSATLVVKNLTLIDFPMPSINVTLDGSFSLDGDGEDEQAWLMVKKTGLEFDVEIGGTTSLLITDFNLTSHASYIELSFDLLSVEGTGGEQPNIAFNLTLEDKRIKTLKISTDRDTSFQLEGFYFNFNNEIVISADQVLVDRGGSVEFLFTIGDVSCQCTITISNLEIFGLHINDIYIDYLQTSGVFIFDLHSDEITIEDGHIVVGGSLHMEVDMPFAIDEINGRIKGIFDFKTRYDTVEIWWNLTPSLSIEDLRITGSASLNVEDFLFMLEYDGDLNVNCSWHSLSMDGYGELFLQDGIFNVSADAGVDLEGFYFCVDDIVVAADVILFAADGSLEFENTTEGVLITADMDVDVVVVGLYLLFDGAEVTVDGEICLESDGLILVDLPGGHLLVDGVGFVGFVVFDMVYDGNLTLIEGDFAFDGFVEAYWDLEDLYFDLAVDAVASVSDFSFMYGDDVVFNVSELSLSAAGSVVVENESDGAVVVSALDADVSLTDLYLRFGDLYVSVSGVVFIESGSSVRWYGYLTLEEGHAVVSGGTSMYVDAVFDVNGTVGVLRGWFNVSVVGDSVELWWNLTPSLSIEDLRITGSASLNVEDFLFMLEYDGDLNVNCSWHSLSMDGYGELFLQDGIFNVSTDVGVDLEVDDLDIRASLLDHVFNFSADQMNVSGTVSFSYNSTGNGVEGNGSLDITLTDVDVFLHLGEIHIEGLVNISGITFYANVTGTATISLATVLPLLSGGKIEIHDFLDITLTDADVFLRIQDVYVPLLEEDADIGNITFSANVTGTAIISLLNLSMETQPQVGYVEYGYFNLTFDWVNLTVGINASNGVLNLNFFEIENIPYIGSLTLTNLSITGYSVIDAGIAFATAYYDNNTNSYPIDIFYIKIRFNNSVDTVVSFDNFSLAVPIEGLEDFPIPIRIYDGLLVEGVFDVFIRMQQMIKFEIRNSTAIDHIGLEIEIPGDLLGEFYPEEFFLLRFYIDEPIDYLNVDCKLGWLTSQGEEGYTYEPGTQYILIDTRNNTETIDHLIVIIAAEFINWLINSSGVPVEPVSNDFGIRFDNLTLQADEFYIYLPNVGDIGEIFNDPNNISLGGGYLHLAEEGNIWFLINGTWYQLDNLGLFALTVEPGHLKLYVDEQLTVNRTIMLPDGTEITIAGTFIGNDSYLEAWWNRTTGFLKLECDLNLSIEDFVLKIDDLANISASAFITASAKGNLTLTINNKNGSLVVYLEECYGVVDIDIDDININLSDITLQGSIDVYLEAGTSGSINISWDESGIISVDGDLGGYANGSLNITDLYFAFSKAEDTTKIKYVNVSVDLFSLVLDGSLQGEAEILLGSFWTGNVLVNVSNAHLVLENCTVTTETIVIEPPKGPTVNITSPSKNDEVNGTITVEGTAYDTNEDGWVEKVEVKIDNGDWQNATFDNETGNWSYVWDTTTVENGNGKYTITAKAFDNDENPGDKSVDVIVNNTGVNWRPIVSIFSPSDKDIVSGIVTISGTASDKDGSVEKVEISIDEGDWQEVEGTTEWSYEWDTYDIPLKQITIEARSYDGEHNSSKDPVKVTVINNLSGILEIHLLNASIEITDLHASGFDGGVINASYIYAAGYGGGYGYVSINPFELNVSISPSIAFLVLTDLYIFLPKQSLSVNITLSSNLSLTGALYIYLGDTIGIEGEGSATITELYLDVNNGQAILSGRSLYFSGTLGFVLAKMNESFILNASVNGSVVLNNVYGKLVGPENGTFEIIIPNKLEIQDGMLEARKDTETSPILLSYKGSLAIEPGGSSWGYIGLGIQMKDVDILGIPLNFTFTLESLYFGVNVNHDQPIGEKGQNEDDASNGKLMVRLDPSSGRCELKTDNDYTSLYLTKLNYSGPKFEVGIGLLNWTRLGDIDWIFDIGREVNSSDSSKGITDNVDIGYFKLKHYTNIGTSLAIKNFHIGFKSLNIDIKRFNMDGQRQGYQYLYVETKNGSLNVVNLTVDMEGTWNGSIDTKQFGLDLEGAISGNCTFHFEPGDDEQPHLDIIIHEPGYLTLFGINHTGIFIPGSLEITLEALELQPGKITIEGGLLNGGGWLKIENHDVNANLGLLKIKKTGLFKIGFIETNLRLLTLSPGETYIEIQTNTETESGSLYIDNTAPIELAELEIFLGTNRFRFEAGVGASIQMEPGECNILIEKLTDVDYDLQLVINNGVFEADVLVLTIKIGKLEISLDKRDFDFSDYDNTITVKLRLRGNKNRAIYIHTTGYIEMTRTTITVTYDDVELFELESFINLEFKFDEFFIGFFDGKLDWGGKIKRKIYLDIFEAMFSFRWKDEGDEYQEISLHGYKNQQIFGINLDATNCTEDITFNLPSLELGRYEITASSTLYAQSYLEFEMDLNLTPTPEEGNNGHNGHFYIYADTDGQYLADFSIKFYREDKGRGLEITAETFMADEFNLSGDSHKVGGVWLPILSSITWTGDIDVVNLVIKVKFTNTGWITIWDGDNLVVNIQGESYEAVAGQTLEFQAYAYGGTPPYIYTWIFPDGVTSDMQNPTYPFMTPSTYTVAVTVTDRNGVTGTATTTVTVQVADRLNN